MVRHQVHVLVTPRVVVSCFDKIGLFTHFLAPCEYGRGLCAVTLHLLAVLTGKTNNYFTKKYVLYTVLAQCNIKVTLDRVDKAVDWDCYWRAWSLVVIVDAKKWPSMCVWFQEEARRHFNCPILEGMELENQGGTGTELNHWEKRLLEVNMCFLCGLLLGSCLGFSVVFIFFYLTPPEWGNDGLAHSEPRVLPADTGHHGGQRLVPCQLQPGPEAGLGPWSRLRLCHEELQILDGQTKAEVTGTVCQTWSFFLFLSLMVTENLIVF